MLWFVHVSQTEGTVTFVSLSYDVMWLIMAAVCNRAGHYIFALWFHSSFSVFFFFMAALCNRADHIYFHAGVSSSFFSSPNLSGRRLDVYDTSTHGVALV